MKTKIYYSGKPITSFDLLPLLYAKDEFNSPACSTVPSIAFWSSPEKHISNLTNHLALSLPHTFRMEFEHKTTPPKGTGNASHTDLMLSWDAVCVGIEVKYTEPPYEMVSKWIKKGKSITNRETVLEGWCDLIQSRFQSEIARADTMNLPYQMIHRLASVCAMPQMRAYLLYQVFNPDNETKEYYWNELQKLRKVIGHSDTVEIWVCWVDILPTNDYQKLLDQWEKKRRNCSSSVITGLIAGSLMSFTEPVFEEIEESKSELEALSNK